MLVRTFSGNDNDIIARLPLIPMGTETLAYLSFQPMTHDTVPDLFTDRDSYSVHAAFSRLTYDDYEQSVGDGLSILINQTEVTVFF